MNSLARFPVRGAVAICALPLLTCGQDAAQTQPHAGLVVVGDTLDLQDEDFRRASIGSDDDPTGVRVFGRVIDATLLPDGGIVVLDRDPPYVRVFDRQGQSEAAFVRHGEGPGEARSPAGVAVRDSDESILVVHDRNVISRFTLTGDFLGRTVLPERRIRAAIPVCDDAHSVFVYGGSAGEVVAGILSETDSSFARITIGGASKNYLERHPLFAAREPNGFLFFHERGDPPTLQRLRCGATSSTMVRDSLVTDAVSRATEVRPNTTAEGPGLRITLTAGNPPYAAGVAATADGYLWLEHMGRRPQDWDERSTRVFAEGLGDGQQLALFPGWYWLHDYRPDVGFLFSADGPLVPEVFVVSPEVLTAPDAGRQ